MTSFALNALRTCVYRQFFFIGFKNLVSQVNQPGHARGFCQPLSTLGSWGVVLVFSSYILALYNVSTPNSWLPLRENPFEAIPCTLG